MKYNFRHDLRKIKTNIINSVSTVVLVFSSVAGGLPLLLTQKASAIATYSNGFEANTADWNNDTGTISQVPSGTDGITAATGSGYAKITGPVFTRWGGYGSTFPSGGYTTKLDVYLDMSQADGATDKRFDFSSAINDTDGNHRRDFIFSLGTAAAGHWAASASNNAPGWPLNPASSRDISQTGWYTLESNFHDNGSGVLVVTMSVKKVSDGSTIGAWNLSDPTDVIGSTVGGNRYGWFTSQRFDFASLAIDNASMTFNSPFSPPASNLQQTQTVHPADLDSNNWFFYNDSNDQIISSQSMGNYQFATDPTNANQSALKFSDPSNKMDVGTYKFAGTALKDIAKIGYSSYNTSPSNAKTYIQFNVDFNGSNTWQNRLTYIPATSNGAWQQNEGVQNGAGLWQWSKMSTGAVSAWPDGATTLNRSWSDIVKAFPNARILASDGGLFVRSEAGSTNYVDKIYLATANLNVNYDFEQLPLPTCAGNDTSFDGFNLGSVNGQHGWTSTGAYDQAIVANTYGYTSMGCKALRLSNGITSGAFGDQTFSYSTPNEAGETSATSGGQSGGTRQTHFEAQFDIASTKAGEQTGLVTSVSPDRGDGSRMSYLRFEDKADGTEVYFDDVQGTLTTANFVETKIATLSRTAPHTIKFSIDYLNGPSNDIVKIYIDGALVHTGTTWENYYRFDSESKAEQSTRTTDSLLFRAGGTAVPANLGAGFLFDNVNITTSTATTSTALAVTNAPATVANAGNINGHGTATAGNARSLAATSNTPAVLGATDVKSDATGQVKGASTTVKEVAIVTAKKSSTLFGLGWWWLAVLAAIVGFFLIVLRRSDSDKKA